MDMQMIIALSVFLICYVFIASEKINKVIISLTGAVILMALNFVPQVKAFEHYVDWNVIFLLLGMMIVMGIMRKTGLFEYVAIYLAKKAKGNPRYIFIMLFFITGIFSALLDNVTIVVIIAPISILIAVELGISPLPFVISQVIASNIGGAATLIGDPPNLMIGSAAGLNFMAFVKNLSLFIFLNMIVSSTILFFFFRKKLVVSNERRARIMEFQEKMMIQDKSLMIYSIIVFVIFICLFVLQESLNLHAATIALIAAVLLLLRAKKLNFEHFLANEVDWGSLLFFMGLFIMVGALVETGLIKVLSDFIIAVTKGKYELKAIGILWTSGIVSGIMGNLPFVTASIPMIKNLAIEMGSQHVFPLWWALSLGACLGGNGSLFGASANIVAVGVSKKSNYPISFWTFTKYGAIITLINLIMSTVFVLVKYY